MNDVTPTAPPGGAATTTPAERLGAFHKSLPHDRFGHVDAAAYQAFAAIANGGGNFEAVAAGPLAAPHHAPWDPLAIVPTKVADLVNPQAGRAPPLPGIQPGALTMPPPPAVGSIATAAEMIELYWMALLRDVPFSVLARDGTATDQPIAEIFAAYSQALSAQDGIALSDLPSRGGHLTLDRNSLFRCGLPDEEKGPIVSQFFLHDVPFGTQLILQQQQPYRGGIDYLTDQANFLLAQDTGLDRTGRSYGTASANPALLEPGPRRRLRDMRDLARFVHRDALHQAYFNAALLLLDWGAPVDDGNPYRPGAYGRQAGFGVLGGPHLLSLVSEVAARALRTVWHWKWHFRRLRPEAYGGLLHMQQIGFTDPKAGGPPVRKDAGLPAMAANSAAGQAVCARFGGYFLPMAFSSGSPLHPAYGAGHATVAGACVTVLKAWFREDATIASVLQGIGWTSPGTGQRVSIVEPDAEGGAVLPEYYGADRNGLTIAGELNKLACNVAMGRSMGGVHWRSDNTRSLRLGETLATHVLQRESIEWAERWQGSPVPLTFTSFDGQVVRIQAGKVTVNGAADPRFPDLRA